MKIKHLIICLLAFSMALTSCGPDNEEYADKVIGNYNMTITPNLVLKYVGQSIPLDFNEISTTCSIAKVDEQGNIVMNIKGVNGEVNDMEMKGYCSGLGMKLEDSSYDGIFVADTYTRLDCNLKFDNPTVSITNAKVLNWSTTVSGKCEMDFDGSGAVITCDVSGTIGFYGTYITK
ncbi:MAG: hypothetical protein IKW54_00975 [Bacteroidales bacterium]|nr:hypothetical protein [Bacteroidales bacterium]MBR5781443.1 hypothetical protein [Bacteroidales bacterium]